MIALIDADSIVYVIAWHHKDTEMIAETIVKIATDNLVKSILAGARATEYIGVFSAVSNFRQERYHYNVYKGNRREKDDWVVRWESIIKQHLVTKWGFLIPNEELEADDIVSGLWYTFNEPEEVIICSPDKDLNQIPGLHFDYKKPDEGIKYLTNDTALVNFWKQVMIGDTTDNVSGIPGIGPVKADKLLNETEAFDAAYSSMVKFQYCKYFGDYYGVIIYQETLDTIQLLQPLHTFWHIYKSYINTVKEFKRPVPDDYGLEETNIAELGLG